MTSVNGLDLEVIDHDITDLEVDAIVNSVNTHMYLGGSAHRNISARVAKKTKGQAQRRLDEIVKTPLKVGDVVVTEGFNLPCKHIFHLATHGEFLPGGMDPDTYLLQCISTGVENVLRKASELEIRTLAIPMIATGTLRLPLDLAVETLVNTIREFIQKTRVRGLKILLVAFRNPKALALLQNAVDQLRIALTESDFFTDKIACNLEDVASTGLEMDISARIPDEASDELDLDLSDLESLVGDPVPERSRQLNRVSQAKPVPEKEYFKEIKRISRRYEEARIQIRNLEERCRVAEAEIRKLRESGADSRELPLPLAYAYNMVRSEISPSIQMERLRRAIGIVLQYHGSIVLADYKAAGVDIPGMNQRCMEILAQPVTDGSWLKLLQEISGAYMSHRIRPALIREIPGLWLDRPDRISQYSGRWQGLINMRNEVHDPALVDDATAMDWLNRALPVWDSIFKLSAGLNRYELLYLEALEDFFGAEGVIYVVKWIMGETLVPRSERVFWNQRLNKGKLYLRDKESGACLDLSPFMAYEYSNVTKTREAHCIEQIIRGRILFSTIRFPNKVELPNHPSPFQA